MTPDLRRHSIAASSRRSLLLSALLAVALLLAGGLGWYLSAAVYGPRLEQGVLFARAVTDRHEAMLDQDIGLRGWQITGDTSFLAPFEQGQARAMRASGRAWSLLDAEELAPRLHETERLAARWSTEHAVPQLALTSPGRPTSSQAARLQEGRALFDAYRASHVQLIAAARAATDALLHERQVVDLLAHGLQVLLASAAVLQVALRRRTLARDLVLPVQDVTHVLHRLADGDQAARPGRYPSLELDALASGVRALAEAAQERGEEADAQRAAASDRATVYQNVLAAAHELSGYLERPELLRALLRSTLQAAGVEEAAVLQVESGRIGSALDSAAREGAEPLLLASALLHEPARDAVRFLRLVSADDGRVAALPLVHGGVVHAVLVVRAAAALDDDRLLTLRSLGLAAGGALTAAALHEQVKAESRSDALTGLYNRRRFEEDLALELGLAERVGVPVSLLLLDVDHFKQFNDTHGHREGDRVLQDLGRLLTHGLRATDSAYRYGGEELAVLLRGASEADAAVVAEQLRADVRSRTPVTVSVGTVTARQGARADAVVETADSALYAAKAAGRDRVERAELAERTAVVPLQLRR